MFSLVETPQKVDNFHPAICLAYSCISSQLAEKVVSDSLGLVDFAIGLVNSVLNLPDWQVEFFEKFKLHKNCVINPAIKNVLGAS